MASWKTKLKGLNKTKNPPENLAEILSTYAMKVGGKKTKTEVQAILDDWLNMEYDFGMKGSLYDELKARYGQETIDRAYAGQAWTPPAHPKPPRHPGAPQVKNPNFTVLPVKGGSRTRRRGKKLNRRRTRTT